MGGEESSHRAGSEVDGESWADRSRTSWEDTDFKWGLWEIPEEELYLLPPADGLDVIDLGCGSGGLASWLTRRGARVIGLDVSGEQLSMADQLQREFDVGFALVQGDAEHTPFHDASFDLAVSVYGASVWCDPYRWIHEAGRILRPGGRLVFLTNSYLLMLTYPEEEGATATTTLLRDHFGRHGSGSQTDPAAVGSHIPHGEMVRLLRDSGFELENLVELGAPPGAVAPSWAMATVAWARRWPNEEVWTARKKPAGSTT
jgi:SAM-dependent methyltransferase